jgi:hypothetical protein
VLLAALQAAHPDVVVRKVDMAAYSFHDQVERYLGGFLPFFRLITHIFGLVLNQIKLVRESHILVRTVFGLQSLHPHTLNGPHSARLACTARV